MRKRMLRLASRGFGNRQIAFTPCRFAVHALSLRPLPCFRKSAALSRVMVATARIVRSYRRRRSGAFRRPRLAGVCGAASARCCRLAPLRPRIRLAIRARRRRERLASPRERPLPPLHDFIAHYQRTICTPAREDARPPSPAGVGVLPCTGVWVPLYRGFIFPCAGAQGEQTRQQESCWQSIRYIHRDYSILSVETMGRKRFCSYRTATCRIWTRGNYA